MEPTLADSPFQEESVEPLEDAASEEITDEDVDESLEPELETDDEELSDEDAEELEEEPSDDEEEDEVVADTVPHAALHKERERRKETQIELHEQQAQLVEANNSIDSYRKSLADIKLQLKELGLDDEIDVKEPREVSEEVLEVRREKEATRQQEQVTTLVTDLREEAALHLEEFPQIDGSDSEQAELILGFAMASTMLGAEKEDAILKAMGILNKHLGNAKKSARRAPPRRQAASATRKASSTTRTAITKGNVQGIFDSYADDMMS